MSPWEIHPALVHFPIAFLVGAVLFDLDAWRRGDLGRARVATGLLWAGVATAVLAAAAGLLAFLTGPASFTEEAGQLVWWHIGFAVAQLVLFAVVAFVRWRQRTAQPATWTRVAGLIAAVLLLLSGYEGGNIVYHGATGIDPTLLAPELREKQARKQEEAAKKPSSGASALLTRPAGSFHS